MSGNLIQIATHYAGGGVSSVTVDAGDGLAPLTAGNALVCFFRTGSSTETFASPGAIQDQASNNLAFTQLSGNAIDAGNGVYIWGFVVPNLPSGITGITLNGSDNGFTTGYVVEVSGEAASSLILGTPSWNVQLNLPIATPVDSGTTTPTAQPNSLIGVAWEVSNNTATFTAGSGFTSIISQTGWAAEIKSGNSSLAAQSATFAQSDDGSSYVSFVVALLESGGAVAPAIGSIVQHRRPVGRGPQMKRTPGVFKRSAGAMNLRSVYLQLFSSPGVVLANTTVNFWTAYDEAGAAIDVLQRTTDANGNVLLSGLKIASGTIEVRAAIPGDVTRSRSFTVIAS